MMPINDTPEVVEISKKGLLSFLREIPKEVLEEICTETNEGGKNKSRVVFCNVVFLVVVVIFLFAGWFKPLERPMPLKYDYSWVVFSLISMLSLQYVDLSNRLRDIFRRRELPPDKIKKTSNAAFLLRWTGLFFIITISALAIRIIWLSFSPEKLGVLHKLIDGLEGQEAIKSLEILGRVFLYLDWVIIASFILGSFLRIVVFLHSYFEDLLKRPWKDKPGPEFD